MNTFAGPGPSEFDPAIPDWAQYPFRCANHLSPSSANKSTALFHPSPNTGYNWLYLRMHIVVLQGRVTIKPRV